MSATNDYPATVHREWQENDVNPEMLICRADWLAACDEIDRLRRWKAEATIVLGYWDDAFERADVTGLIGCFKPTLMADEINRLRDDLAHMTARCDPHVPSKPPVCHLQATQTVETPTDSPTNGERKP